MVIVSVINSKPLTYDEYVFPPWANSVGWVVASSSMMLVPAYILYKLLKARGTFKQVSLKGGNVMEMFFVK